MKKQAIPTYTRLVVGGPAFFSFRAITNLISLTLAVARCAPVDFRQARLHPAPLASQPIAPAPLAPSATPAHRLRRSRRSRALSCVQNLSPTDPPANET